MSRCVAAFAVAIILASSSIATAQQYPRIGYVFPAGGRQGTTFLVTVGGQFLGSWKGEYHIDVLQAHFSGDGITAEVVKDVEPMREKEANALRQKAQQLSRNKPDAEARKEIAQIKRKVTRYQSAQIVKQTYPAIGDTVTVRVTLAADAAPGPREIRVETPRGISNPLRFFVGRLPEFQKPEPEIVVDARDPSEPSYPPAPTTDITLPAVVNGQIIPRNPEMLWQRSDRFTPGTADRYRFEARKGQQLVIAAAARELIPYLADAVPGWFQATLALYDAKGRQVAYDDDYRFHPDPVLLFEVPEDGQYVVEIKDAIYRGRPDFVYRITLGELPYITGSLPVGRPGRGGDHRQALRLEPAGRHADDRRPGHDAGAPSAFGAQGGDDLQHGAVFRGHSAGMPRTGAQRFDASRPAGHASGDRQRANRPARRLGRVPFRRPRRPGVRRRGSRPPAGIAVGQCLGAVRRRR